MLTSFGLLGCSPAFTAAMGLMRRFAETSAHVLVQGETGTGKELVARAIHYLGERRYKPFVPVNCGALPDNLMENELFGHARGAFTDARESQRGLIGSAEGGTLFLDEIECLSLKGQVALLRFLQDGHYRQLGGHGDLRADVRIVAASNQDFSELVRNGQFRQDLYYRLAIMSVDLPPLRQRGNDILLLIDHFLARFAREYRRPVPVLDRASAAAALTHAWPGNVRELENIVHRQFLLAEEGVVHLEPISDSAAASGASEASGGWNIDFAGMDMKLAKAEVIARFERDYLEQAIAMTRGNVSLAAQHAGKERRAFGKLLKKYGIDRNRFQA
ncbi:MAG: sigma-54-dependent Fis family transcriptional regulator [Proteobacteria bacterium]|nr:sigma-54-dependent Fis family transcriptional regulator [Pseudomonadota bacterium]MBS0553319.1 sigma-54-dependent Fis family transcriptional regulator [Pseudomonadota bacterium]